MKGCFKRDEVILERVKWKCFPKEMPYKGWIESPERWLLLFLARDEVIPEMDKWSITNGCMHWFIRCHMHWSIRFHMHRYKGCHMHWSHLMLIVSVCWYISWFWRKIVNLFISLYYFYILLWMLLNEWINMLACYFIMEIFTLYDAAHPFFIIFFRHDVCWTMQNMWYSFW